MFFDAYPFPVLLVLVRASTFWNLFNLNSFLVPAAASGLEVASLDLIALSAAIWALVILIPVRPLVEFCCKEGSIRLIQRWGDLNTYHLFPDYVLLLKMWNGFLTKFVSNDAINRCLWSVCSSIREVAAWNSVYLWHVLSNIDASVMVISESSVGLQREESDEFKKT